MKASLKTALVVNAVLLACLLSTAYVNATAGHRGFMIADLALAAFTLVVVAWLARTVRRRV